MRKANGYDDPGAAGNVWQSMIRHASVILLPIRVDYGRFGGVKNEIYFFKLCNRFTSRKRALGKQENSYEKNLALMLDRNQSPFFIQQKALQSLNVELKQLNTHLIR
ncbi:MAG: hypothetical protein WDN26_16795 [Chitinophagaceae bacterium]